MSGQVDLNGEPLPPHIVENEHLTTVKPACPSTFRAVMDRNEAWCIECAGHITVGKKEYGHSKDCEHWIGPFTDGDNDV